MILAYNADQDRTCSWRAFAPPSEPLLVCAVDLLPATKEEGTLTLQASFW